MLMKNHNSDDSKEELINKSKILFNKGVKIEKSGDLELAIRIYQMVLRFNPAFREAYINLGNLLFKNRKFRLALASFKKALELEKGFVIYFNIGVLFYRIGRYKSAAYMLDQALKLKPDFARALLLSGFSYSQNGDYENGERAFKALLEKEPNHSQALYAITYLYCRQKNYHDAGQHIKKLLKIDPASEELQNLNTKISFHLNDGKKIDEKALAKSLDTMIRSEPSFKEYNEFIVESQKIEPEKYKKLNSEIDNKIKSMKNEYESDSSFDSKKWMDLSLFYLFRGKPNKAVKALSKAKSQMSA